MITPLFKGDTIAIVATAKKIHKEELNFSIQWLKTQGYEVLLGDTIDKEYHQFSGTDDERALDFQNMLNNPKIKAIWCARGGYGTVRIIEKLDFLNFKKNPKWIIGYSDITVLHSHIHNLKIPTLHGPLAFDLEKTTVKAQFNLQQVLQGRKTTIEFEADSNNSLGIVEGQVVGGNLSVLYSLCGSSSMIDTAGKILFLEDLDEYYYHIDRMLQNLKRNGVFENIEGLIVGGMTNMHDNQNPFGISIPQMLDEIIGDYDIPIAYNAPFGHVENNHTLVLGCTYQFYVSQEKVVVKKIAYD